MTIYSVCNDLLASFVSPRPWTRILTDLREDKNQIQFVELGLDVLVCVKSIHSETTQCMLLQQKTIVLHHFINIYSELVLLLPPVRLLRGHKLKSEQQSFLILKNFYSCPTAANNCKFDSTTFTWKKKTKLKLTKTIFEWKATIHIQNIMQVTQLSFMINSYR